VVGTFDGSTQRLYVNGSLLVSRSQTGTASVTSNPLYLGSWSGSSEFFPGTIDEAAVYSKVLGASAVASHYNAATTG
jgi:large repetitive protein